MLVPILSRLSPCLASKKSILGQSPLLKQRLLHHPIAHADFFADRFVLPSVLLL